MMEMILAGLRAMNTRMDNSDRYLQEKFSGVHKQIDNFHSEIYQSFGYQHVDDERLYEEMQRSKRETLR